jgi:glycosyltransferase involved in cell wall biosynthesis
VTRPALAKFAALPLDVPVLLYIDAAVIGGSTNYTVMLAAGMRRRGYRVSVLCKSLAVLEPMRDELRAADVEVLSVDTGDFTMLGRARRLARFVRVLRGRRRSVLLLLMGYFHGGGPLALAARLAGVAAVLRADLQPPMPPISRWERFTTKAKDRLFDRFVVGSEDNRRSYVTLLGRDPRSLRVIHTGIELDGFHPDEGRADARAEIGVGPDELLVGVVSRIGDDWERKGIGILLEALPVLARKRPEARFVIVGDGSTRARHEAAVRSLGLSEKVSFVGWRTDARRLLAAMDVFVMPSTFEGGPTTVIEAMAMARPIVATAVGMVPEILEDGVNGLVIAPWSADALTSAVARLLGDPSFRSRLGAAARVSAAGHGIEAMLDRYIVLCGELWREQRREAPAARASTVSRQSSDRPTTPRA